jgi:site-specific recombinase XerD
MLERLIKRKFYQERHQKLPLLDEREQYLEMLSRQGYKNKSLRQIANHLYWVVQLLPLKNKGVSINFQLLDEAVEQWSRSKTNFTVRGQILTSQQRRFRNCAIQFLRSIGLLEEKMPEESVPVFCHLYRRGSFLRQYSTAPLLEERIRYLQYWQSVGAKDSTLRRISEYLLTIMEYLDFSFLRKIKEDEINMAADKWASRHKELSRGIEYSKSAKRRFKSYTIQWLEMLGCLDVPTQEPFLWQNLLEQYGQYQLEERGLSEKTVAHDYCTLKEFLREAGHVLSSFSKLTPQIIDHVFLQKANKKTYSRETIKGYVLTVKSFLRYAEDRNLCKEGLSDCIQGPRTYALSFLPVSPSWESIEKMVTDCKTDYPTDIRDYAILQLLTVYGLRSSEVSNLRLKDIDWRKELVHVRRAKKASPQTFPLIKSVGEAILDYIKRVRPRDCHLEFIFLNMRSPYAPLSTGGMYQLVNKRLKPLSLAIPHLGPHCLRHANATHLINQGFPMEAISAQLGHKDIESTRIYAKVDLSMLSKVSEMDWEDIL